MAPRKNSHMLAGRRRAAGDKIKQAPKSIKIQCPLAHCSPRCASSNTGFKSIQKLNEHIKRTHFGQGKPKPGAHQVSNSQMEAISLVTKKHHLKSPQEKLRHIRKVIFPTESTVAVRPTFQRTCDELKAAAKVIGLCKRRDQLDPETYRLVARISSLATDAAGRKDTSGVWWFGGAREDEKYEHLRRACHVFRFFVEAMQVEAYNPPPEVASGIGLPPPKGKEDEEEEEEQDVSNSPSSCLGGLGPTTESCNIVQTMVPTPVPSSLIEPACDGTQFFSQPVHPSHAALETPFDYPDPLIPGSVWLESSFFDSTTFGSFPDSMDTSLPMSALHYDGYC